MIFHRVYPATSHSSSSDLVFVSVTITATSIFFFSLSLSLFYLRSSHDLFSCPLTINRLTRPLATSRRPMRLPGQRRDLQQLAGRLYARLFTYASSSSPKPESTLRRTTHFTSGVGSSESSPVESPHPHYRGRSSSAAPTSHAGPRESAVARPRRLKPSLRSRAPTSGPIVSSGLAAAQPSHIRLTFEDQLQLARVKTGALSGKESAISDGSPLVSASHPQIPPSASVLPRLSTSASAVVITGHHQHPPASSSSHFQSQQRHLHLSTNMPSSGNFCSLTTHNLFNTLFFRSRTIRLL